MRRQARSTELFPDRPSPDRPPDARRWLAVGAALALTLLLGTGCIVLPDGTFVSNEPRPGTPFPAWNDPDDGLVDAPISLADVGYVEDEQLIAGNATSYRQSGPWLQDGVWAVEPADTQSFHTRLLIRRPADPARFNGVVVVEWLNVTGGSDLDALFRPLHTELLQKGYAWVGVSAQKAGVDDLVRRNPSRYWSLHHPGDAYAFDIFTRAGRAVADPASTVLGGLDPSLILAAGSSQSAAALLTYINAVHPVSRIYDGFQLVSVLGGGLPIAPGAP